MTWIQSRSVDSSMGNCWSVHLPQFLEPTGTLAPMVGRGLRLAQYWTQIVAQASNYEEPTSLRCRRRPGRKPCAGLLTIFFDVDNFDVCSSVRCDDNGRTSGWEGTFWDNNEMRET